jgi:hypothetical protein
MRTKILPAKIGAHYLILLKKNDKQSDTVNNNTNMGENNND